MYTVLTHVKHLFRDCFAHLIFFVYADYPTLTFTWQIVTPADKVTLPNRPGNLTRRVIPPIMQT